MKGLALYGTICIGKMMAMPFLTVGSRSKHSVYANPEDTFWHRDPKKEKRIVHNDTNVERVRRNHLNDLENIPPFILIGILYVMSKPAENTALWHFRVFTVSRILHTLCYQFAIPQPSRALMFSVAWFTTASMANHVIKSVMSYSLEKYGC